MSTLLGQVEQLQQSLHVVRIVQRALVAVCVLLAILVMRQATRVLVPDVAALSYGPVAFVAITAAAAAYWWRRPKRPALDRTALWVEERTATPPDFALTTAVELLAERQPVGEALLAAAQRTVDRARPYDALRDERLRAWRAPALFASCCLALLIVSGVIGERAVAVASTSIAPATTQATRANAAAVPLGAWNVEVQPPPYTALPSRRLGDVTSVTALSGSRIVIRGTGAEPAMSVQVLTSDSAARTLSNPSMAPADSGWQAVVTAVAAPVSITLSRGGKRRLFVVEGRADSVPLVSLDAPARDSVFREPRGALPLIASVRDDIGLSQASFELLVSSGEGERFTVRTVTMSAMRWSAATRATRATLRGTLDLEALKLQAGDVVHLRAIARDWFPGNSREYGSSETRAFRIARPAEYDSVAVEPAPPPEVDKSLMSQRMLLMLTEKLDKAQKRMARPEVTRESLKLAREQARLRLAVGDVVFQRLSGESSAEHAHSAGDGHDHGVDLQGGKLSMSTSSTTGMLEEGNDSPVVAINQPLLEAYNAMWDAGRALEQGDPHGAIPPMKRALEAIERSRAASRLYLRGKPPQVIVDIAKVRLAGKDTGLVNRRSPRGTVPSSVASRDARLVHAALLATTNAEAARDSLAMLRAESLADAPAVASALARVMEALARGGDATQAFVEARRVLGVVVRTPGSVWSRGVVP